MCFKSVLKYSTLSLPSAEQLHLKFLSWKKPFAVLAWLVFQVLFFIGLFIEGVRAVARGYHPDAAAFGYNVTICLGNFNTLAH